MLPTLLFGNDKNGNVYRTFDTYSDHLILFTISIQINSDGYLDLESGMAQATRLPPERRASAEKAMQTCVNAGKNF